MNFKKAFRDFIEDLKKEKIKYIFVFAFFAIYLLLGLFIYKDYGISSDEGVQYHIGKLNNAYVLGNGEEILTNVHNIYGPAFEFLLSAPERIFGLEDEQSIFFMRHLLTFLSFYVSTIVFYLLLRKKFNWQWSLLGVAFLIFSPRIFAHSFYNNKDVAFLSVFLIGIYTLLLFFKKRHWIFILLHAFVSGFCIDTRILGILIPALTILWWLKSDYWTKNKERSFNRVVLYLTFTAFFTILMWPYLWSNPIGHFIFSFLEMRQFENTIVPNLYLGELYDSTMLPWHYAPIWILITTPVLYTIGFLTGLFLIVWQNIKKIIYSKSLKKIKILDTIVLVWFFLPLLMVVFLRSALYDAWRHLFFIYPAFIFISIYGLSRGYKYICLLKNLRYQKIFRRVFISFIILSLGYTGGFIYFSHPHQNVYFNEIFIGNTKWASRNFDYETWGSCYRKALEYILENDDRDLIEITSFHDIPKDNAKLLDEDDKERLIFVKDEAEADYYVVHYRREDFIEDYLDREYYSYWFNGERLFFIAKLK